MSRIFDALRKSELENAGPTPIGPVGKAPGVKHPVAVREEFHDVLESVEGIPLSVAPQKHILTCSDNHAVGAEKFRVLRQRLQKLRADRPLSKLLVSSAVPREGKTLVAVNLAFSLSRISRRVLLMDADLRHPGVHEVFGFEALPGLTEYLQGELDDASAMRRLDPWNLYYMPAGRSSAAPGELLQGARMAQLLNRLGEVFEWVVVDTAPITLFADSPHLAGLVDGALLVVRLGLTPVEAMQQAVAALEGNYVAGLVINGKTENHAYDHDYYRYTEGEASENSGTNMKSNKGDSARG